MSAVALDNEGAMQQAPQPERHSKRVSVK